MIPGVSSVPSVRRAPYVELHIRYLESHLILGIPPSTPMDWRFEPVWTPDKTPASTEADAWGGDRADPLRTASSALSRRHLLLLACVAGLGATVFWRVAVNKPPRALRRS
jgi:hypothetical protein